MVDADAAFGQQPFNGILGSEGVRAPEARVAPVTERPTCGHGRVSVVDEVQRGSGRDGGAARRRAAGPSLPSAVRVGVLVRMPSAMLVSCCATGQIAVGEVSPTLRSL